MKVRMLSFSVIQPKILVQVFFKRNVRYPVWTDVQLRTLSGSLKHLRKNLFSVNLIYYF